MSYEEALKKQKWERSACRIVKVEALPDCYRLTNRGGWQSKVTLEFGREHFPLALCVNE